MMNHMVVGVLPLQVVVVVEVDLASNQGNNIVVCKLVHMQCYILTDKSLVVASVEA